MALLNTHAIGWVKLKFDQLHVSRSFVIADREYISSFRDDLFKLVRPSEKIKLGRNVSRPGFEKQEERGIFILIFIGKVL